MASAYLSRHNSTLSHRAVVQDEKGAAGLEFTILVPFFLLLLFGIIEFGSMAFNKQMLTNAAR